MADEVEDAAEVPVTPEPDPTPRPEPVALTSKEALVSIGASVASWLRGVQRA